VHLACWRGGDAGYDRLSGQGIGHHRSD
jgi:hypothetical protein